MSKENMVICCVPESVYELVCETLRMDAHSKAFEPELRSDIAALVDILANESRTIPAFDFPNSELPEAMRNNLLTDYYLSLLTGTVMDQKLGWNQEAVVEVKKAAFAALKKHYSVELPADDPKSILLRQATAVSSSDELSALGFSVDGKLAEKGWDVNEKVLAWRHPDGCTVLTEDYYGKHFICHGEKSDILVRELVGQHRWARFIAEAQIVFPTNVAKSDSKKVSGFMRYVWQNLAQKELHTILEYYKYFRVYSLISTENGYRLVEGERGHCTGFILTKNHVFIDGGLDVPLRDLEISGMQNNRYALL